MAVEGALLDASAELRARGSGSTTRGLSPCSRVAWGFAASGGVLFLAGVIQAIGSWAVSAGAVSLTLAAITGVIAMEGCEEASPRSSPPARRRSPVSSP